MHRRHAFTLAELLVTMTIIGMLAAATLGGLMASRRQARIQQTRATIVKLDRIISQKWDAYRTRQLPISMGTLRHSCEEEVELPPPPWWSDPSKPYTVKRINASEVRRFLTNTRRDLIRMELPDRWSDVTNPPLVLEKTPAVTLRFRRLRDQAIARGVPEATVNGYASPELLYMIVSQTSEDLALFHDREFGDVDGDGLREFHDSWGRPIAFVRWPAGFMATYDAVDSVIDPSLQDPYDPDNLTGCYALHPLVYSPGPDGQYDINRGTQPSGTYAYRLDGRGNIDTCTPDENEGGYLIGQPLDATMPDGSPADEHLGHHDNIHNHGLRP